jgi:hypothetical protein
LARAETHSFVMPAFSHNSSRGLRLAPSAAAGECSNLPLAKDK